MVIERATEKWKQKKVKIQFDKDVKAQLFKKERRKANLIKKKKACTHSLKRAFDKWMHSFPLNVKCKTKENKGMHSFPFENQKLFDKGCESTVLQNEKRNMHSFFLDVKHSKPLCICVNRARKSTNSFWNWHKKKY